MLSILAKTEETMSKRFSFEFEPFTDDQLKAMSSDELQLFLIKFKRLIKEARKAGKSTAPFEVEFCYLDNEKQRRQRFERR